MIHHPQKKYPYCNMVIGLPPEGKMGLIARIIHIIITRVIPIDINLIAESS